MSFTTNDVLNALRYVDDPDLKKDLVTLNMVDNIKVNGKKVSFRLILTTPACPLKDQIKNACIVAIKHLVDKEAEVEVDITSQVTTNRAGGQQVLSGIKNIIAVAAGKGGVGKSTVAVNLAVGLAQTGASVGLIDADIFGPSVPIMFGLQGYRPQLNAEGLDGKPKIIPAEKYGVKTLSIGFLADEGQAVVWRGPMASSALRQFITDADWGELDYLIIDLPPGTSDVHLTLVQTVPVTSAVIVTTPQAVAMADVVKAIGMFNMPQIKVPILGIVENMAYFTPSDAPDKKYYIFGHEGGGQKLADQFDLPLLGQLPILEPVCAGGDAGKPAILQGGSLADTLMDIVYTTARYIAIQNAATYNKTAQL